MTYEEKYKTWNQVSEYASKEIDSTFPNWIYDSEKYSLAEATWKEIKGRIIEHFEIANMSYLTDQDLEKAKEISLNTIKEYTS